MDKHRIIYRFPKYVKDSNGKQRRIHPFSKYKTDNETFQADTFQLTKEELQKEGFFNKKNHSLCVHEATKHDVYNDLERGPQTISDKDLGLVAAHIPVTKQTTMLELGCGSGKATTFFANIANHVDTYDVSKKNISLAKKNTQKMSLNNISFHNENAHNHKAVERLAYDAALVDIPTPEKSIQTVVKALKTGGIVAFYTVHVTQFKEIVKKAPKELRHQKTVSVKQEEWKVEHGASRPRNTQRTHTGYLSFYRKIARC